jgi:dTDP-4-dehydrorhamnose reductase
MHALQRMNLAASSGYITIMRILVTGARGLLGQRLVSMLESVGHSVTGWDVGELDITDHTTTLYQICDLAPELVIHCAAMTNVDRCAELPDEALRVNGYGAHNVALAAAECGAALLHISTNEVFDGERSTPYLEYDTTRPINPYGYSKWVAEQAIMRTLTRYYIVRISWLFGHGGANFLQKITQAAAEGRPLSVVTNEVAAPTYTDDLCEALLHLIDSGRYGIYHLPNEGGVSRYGFAREILDAAGYADVSIQPINSVQWPRPSRPPTYATLRNFNAAQVGIRLRPWQEAVELYFAREKELAASRA